MRSFYSAVLFVMLSFSSFAQTWTIHNCKDNYLYVVIYGEWTGIDCGGIGTWGPSYATDVYWDFAGDIEYPEWAYSGARSSVMQCPNGWVDTTLIVGYKDCYTFTWGVGEVGYGGSVIAGGGNSVSYEVWYISGGFPDYGGGIEFARPDPGESWIDFASDGSVRVSNIQSPDFGKWAWDGSVNPSWVEPPLAPVQQGKRLAKGHNK